jgi:hypothetical protein
LETDEEEQKPQSKSCSEQERGIDTLPDGHVAR